MVRLSAEAVLRALEALGARHLILTGEIGCGKSTLRAALSEALGGSLAGLVSVGIPGQEIRLRLFPSGAECPVGRPENARKEGRRRMQALPEGFEGFGVRALAALSEAPSEWVFVDEIGYLEADCPGYRAELCRLIEKKRLLAVIRREELPVYPELSENKEALVLDLNAPFAPSGCVQMASGFGRRFGGNKLLAPFGGGVLIDRAFAAARPFGKRVTVTRYEEVAARSEAAGIPAILHGLPYRSDTIRLGLRFLGPGLGGYCFFPSDQPLLSEASVQALLICAKKEPACIWRAAYQGEGGAPQWFPAEFYPALCALPEGEGGNRLSKAYPERVRTVEVGRPEELEDVDHPEDIERLESFL